MIRNLSCVSRYRMATGEMRTNSSHSDIRILLVGRTGHGKSSTGNSILGREQFETGYSAAAVTATTQWSGRFFRFGRNVEVVDTPGFFDTHRTEREIHRELIKTLILTSPGFHAIAFVLEKGRFTEEMVKTKDLFFEWFGEDVEKYACIILTRTEDEKSVNKYISSKSTEGLQDLVQRCGGKNRIAPIENKSENIERREKQVKRILDMVEEIKIINNNTHFSNVAFKLATAYVNNHFSDAMSSTSIRILRNAGVRVSDRERRMFDNLLGLTGVETCDFSDCESDFVRVAPKRNRREDRKVDINSVQVVYRNTHNLATQSTSRESSNSHVDVHSGAAEMHLLHDFKRDVGSGRTDESGFLRYLQRAWIYSKRQLGCIII